jgi:predicted RNA polymerase sigma factor
MVTLNRIVALAMVHGPRAGLRELDAAQAEPALGVSIPERRYLESRAGL